MPDQPGMSVRARRLWPALAVVFVVGILGVAGWWWAPGLVRTAAVFLDADLGVKDSYSSVLSMFIGVAALVTSTSIGVLQLYQGRRGVLEPHASRGDEDVDGSLRLMRDIPALQLRVHPAIQLPPGHEAFAGTAKGRRRFRWYAPWPSRRTTAPEGAHGLDRDLPTFVDRDRLPLLRQLLHRARNEGGFIVMVGNSCVGKTRLLYEAAREVLPDFEVLAPDLGDGNRVNRVAEARHRPRRLIVWLDELQRFLAGPYLTAGSTPISSAAVRRLLGADDPVVIVGTLWPEYKAELRALDQDNNSDRVRPRFPDAMDILNNSRLNELTLEPFSAAERQAAARLADRDPRLHTAVADTNYKVTEVLAGAPELVRRYEQASQEQRAILDAAIDARRVGLWTPVAEQLLCKAARGYLSTAHPDDSWFGPALAELTSADRPHDRATAPLAAVTNDERREVIGYLVADYLLQRLVHQRRSVRLPALAWKALVDHDHAPDDVERLAASADKRLLYQYAEPLYVRIHAGRSDVVRRLADIVLGQGRTDEAIDALRYCARGGHREAQRRLVDLLVVKERTDELRNRAGAGDGYAAYRLAPLLVEQGNVDEAIEVLQRRSEQRPLIAVPEETPDARIRTEPWYHKIMDAEDAEAVKRLATLLTGQGRHAEAIDVLRDRADRGDGSSAGLLDDLLANRTESELEAAAETDDWRARLCLADRLVKQGRADEAMLLLRLAVDAGDLRGSNRLADLLGAAGRIEEAIEVLRIGIDAGDLRNSQRLSELLLGQGRADEAIEVLRRRVDAGRLREAQGPLVGDSPVYAEARLAELLRELGRVDALRARSEAGDDRAGQHLGELLIEQGHVDEAIAVLRTTIHGDVTLVDLLVKLERVDELRALVESGNARTAADALARLLAAQGRIDEAITVLENDEARSGYSSGQVLVDLLAERGVDALRTSADAGNMAAANRLADTLIKLGAIDELRADVDAGIFAWAENFIPILFQEAADQEAVSRFGLNADGSIARQHGTGRGSP